MLVLFHDIITMLLQDHHHTVFMSKLCDLGQNNREIRTWEGERVYFNAIIKPSSSPKSNQTGTENWKWNKNNKLTRSSKQDVKPSLSGDGPVPDPFIHHQPIRLFSQFVVISDKPSTYQRLCEAVLITAVLCGKCYHHHANKLTMTILKCWCLVFTSVIISIWTKFHGNPCKLPDRHCITGATRGSKHRQAP